MSGVLAALDRVLRATARGFAAAMRPVDIAWLVGFRAFFGAAMTISMLRFIHYGWIDRLFVKPRFHFKYWGFEWVEALGPEQMHWLFWGLVACAACLTLGLFYRLVAPAFALGLTYFQLIDVSTYLNHYYLAALFAWLLAFAPANRAWSVDAWLRRRLFRATPLEETVAAGWLYLLRFQVAIVYTFAGLAKAQPDWLLHAQPLRIWLGASTDLPLIGPLLTIEGIPLFMSWFGFLFDTTIPWWMSFSRTRPYAYVVVILFHVATRVFFPIGMFPVIMVLAALMFFAPSWPRVAMARLRRLAGRLRKRGFRPWEAETLPFLDSPSASPRLWHKLAVAFGVFLCALNLVMPLRYLAYGGNVLWHEQGARFAWRVMLRAKGGVTTFVVHSSRTGDTWHVSPRSYLNNLQEDEMSGQPDLILQLAHRIKDDYEARGYGPVEVRADSRSSLNGRRSRRLIDEHVDLAQVSDGLAPASWVLAAPTCEPPHTRPVL